MARLTKKIFTADCILIIYTESKMTLFQRLRGQLGEGRGRGGEEKEEERARRNKKGRRGERGREGSHGKSAVHTTSKALI